ncbi:hypothetical protein MANES_11G093478v8 [Manihot esculenta]|uniref:Uncharacterized protein n=1 Tax=Manihot esculenta TaxID=3983 RepID=A0ACB7GWI6_MANES|nr:hypothetical protein MANES_11G093478v8 [Manihot esculenta]
MSNIFSSHVSQTFDSVAQFLDHSYQTKNVIAIKKLHARLLRTGLLFFSLNIHCRLIFACTTCINKNNLQTLTNCCKFLNPINPLPFNLLLSNFCRNGFPLLALKTCSLMHITSVSLDTYALCSSLKASSSMEDVNFGKQIHAHVTKSGWLSSVFVGSALIDLYAKSSFVGHAAMVFDEIPVKNTVCANALLSGYVEGKLWDQGIKLLRNMPCLSLDYDHFTLAAMLRTCAGLSAIELGRQVHAYLTRKINDLGNDVFLQSSLIEMYGKCGFVEKALQVFNLEGYKLGGKVNRDIVLWTSMLGAYGTSLGTACGTLLGAALGRSLVISVGISALGIALVIVLCTLLGASVVVSMGTSVVESVGTSHGKSVGASVSLAMVVLGRFWLWPVGVVASGNFLPSGSAVGAIVDGGTCSTKNGPIHLDRSFPGNNLNLESKSKTLSPTWKCFLEIFLSWKALVFVL